MTKFLHSFSSLFTANVFTDSGRNYLYIQIRVIRLSLFSLFLCSGFNLSAQEVDNWYSADRAINSPSPVSALHLFTPYAPADGTPVNVWYDLVDFTIPAFRQDAFEHPNPVNYANPWENYPNHGFEHPGGPGFLTPTGAIPGIPTLRRDAMNFNPAVEFDGTAVGGAGEALYFRSHAREDIIVFIVFSATGAGNSAETQSLLFGGDIQNHLNSITNLSLGVSSGNRFSVGRTWDTGTFFQAGGIDLLERPTIGTFIRQTGADQETLTTRVNGLIDPNINGLVRNDVTADENLFYYNRMGKHFNDTDPGGVSDPSNLSGQIAEVFLMDGIVNANHIQRMESYLAIKYGITLNAAGTLGSISGNDSYNYLAADGTIIWPFDTLYQFDIAGIGKDRFNDSGANRLRYNLHQRISKSVNTEARVTISTNADFGTDNLNDGRTPIDTGNSPLSTLNNYLVWGNDHGDTAVPTSDDAPPGVDGRIRREWRIIETRSGGANPIANVSVRVDLTDSDLLNYEACELFLIIDEDGTGDFGDGGPITYIEASSKADPHVFFDNVNFSGTDIFTFAYLEDTEPPTGSIASPLNVCDVPPVPDPNLVTADDNCAVQSVAFISDVFGLGANPTVLTRTYRITDTSGNTTNIQQTINIYTTPFAGTSGNLGICASGGASTDLFAALGAGTDLNGSWSDDDTSGVLPVNPANNVDFSALGAGTYNYTYTVDAVAPSPCQNAVATVTVTISAQATAEAGDNASICGEFEHIVQNASASGHDNFTWSITTGNGLLLNGNTLAPTYRPDPTDMGTTVVLQLEATNAASCDATDTVQLNYIAQPTLANAGPDIAQCDDGSFTMAANVAVVGSGTWSEVGGPAGIMITTMNDPLTTVTGLAAGSSATLRWTIANVGCPDSFDELTITNNTQPTADAHEPAATTDFQECGLTHEVDALDAIGTGTWSQVAGPGNLSFGTNANDPDQTLTVDAFGSYTFRWTDVNGSCTSSNDINVEFYEDPTVANAGLDIVQCGNDSFNMAANTPVVGAGTWSLLIGPVGVMIADVNEPSTMVTGLAAGSSATLRWTIANGACLDSFDDVTITNNLQPAISVDTFSNPTTCGGSDGGIDLFFNNVPDGLYTIIHDSGNFPNVNVSFLSATITGLPAGNYNNLRITINGCSSTDDPDVSIVDPTSPNIGLGVDAQNDPICENTGTNIRVENSELGVSYQLRNDANNNSIGLAVIGTGFNINLPTGNLTATTTFNILAINASGCQAELTSTVTVTITAQPTVDTLGDVTVCDSFELPALTDGDYFTGTGGTGSALSAGDDITTSQTVFIYAETGTTPNCSAESSFDVTINTTPTVDTLGDVTVCDSFELPALTDGDYFTGTGGTGSALSAGDDITTSQTVFIYAETGTTPNCSAESSFDVTINTTPTVDTLGDVTVCDSFELPALTDGDYFTGTGGTGSALSAGDDITTSQTVFIYAETGTTPNCSAESSFDVTIEDNEFPTADNLLTIDLYCQELPNPDPSVVTGESDNCGVPTVAWVEDISDGNSNPETIIRTYSVTDASGNSIQIQQLITLNQTIFNIDIEPENGLVRVSESNGLAPYTVRLNNMPDIVFEKDTFIIDGLTSGNYTLNIVDAQGCETTESFIILMDEPNINATVEQIYNCDASNSIRINLEDPSVAPDILYALDSSNSSDFVINPNFSNISSGEHFLSILHSNGNLLDIPFEIEDITLLQLDLSSTNINEITAIVSGGTPPYTYFFEDFSGSQNNIFTVSSDGTFTVRVVDSLGCETQATMTLNFLDLEIPNFFTPNNDGQNDVWKAKNTEGFPNMFTIIYDRYGREIKLMGHLDTGWDGLYESKAMPSGDYWYIIELNDGSGHEFVGHFTLYR